MNPRLRMVALVISALVAAGCNDSKPAPVQSIGPSPDGQKLLLSTEPAGATGVIEARKIAKDGDEIVILGRIGGEKNPWIEGKAGFLIVDSSFTPCSEREDDNCPTPWDYCCDSTEQVSKGMATIKFVDEQGQTIGTDARKLLGLKELNTVVVKGKVKRDKDGNMIVLASGLFRRPDQKK